MTAAFECSLDVVKKQAAAQIRLYHISQFFLLCSSLFYHIARPSEINLKSLEMHLQCHPLT